MRDFSTMGGGSVDICDKKGIVFNIQRFSLHDGPGIRTLVFLKGCPLRCMWCSNPESLDPNPLIITKKTYCIGCNKCLEVCHNKASGADDCDFCLACVEACPTGARTLIGKKMTVSEVVAAVEKDRPFYRRSTGGVTFTGGEPLLQSEFLGEVIKVLKEKHIHVAVETSGFSKWEPLWLALKNVDLILFDLKFYDSEMHQKYTGVSNSIILENAVKLSSLANVLFRIPIIPGYNDSESNLSSLAEFIKSCSSRAEVNLLPYHGLGINKYDYINKRYLLKSVKRPTDLEMKQHLNLMLNLGLDAKII